MLNLLYEMAQLPHFLAVYPLQVTTIYNALVFSSAK